MVGWENMKSETLHIQMLGKFTVYYGTNPIVFNKSVSAKSLRLFQILLLSGKKGLPKSELIDCLYGWGDPTGGGNRNRNLNNLIYRLKGLLVSAGLPEGNYVAIRDGICYWNSEIPLEIDVIHFEELSSQAELAQGDKRVRLCRKAKEVYRGELLPMNMSDLWFYGKNVYLKELYLWVVDVLEEEYRKTGNYKELLKLYTHAAEIYPFDGWQVSMMRCCLAMHRNDEALDIYNKTAELYAREMGIPPMEEMQECFDQIMFSGRHSQQSQEQKIWQAKERSLPGKEDEIAKSIFEEDKDSGAYYCTYPSFVDHCRLTARMMEGCNKKVLLMFLNLSQNESKAGREGDFVRQMERLKEAVGRALSRKDVYTRYGSSHYILMLLDMEREACASVFGQIEKIYQKLPDSRGELWYHVAELSF